MDTVLVGIVAVAWYGIGLLGSAIAFGGMLARFDERYPRLAPFKMGRGDRIVSFSMAVAGPLALVSTLLFSLAHPGEKQFGKLRLWQ